VTNKQAKTLRDEDVARLIKLIQKSRYPIRDRVMILLSAKAGLRAGEIAQLTWPMVLTATGRISTTIELRNHAAKKGSGRTIPMHPLLRMALMAWLAETRSRASEQMDGPVIISERCTQTGLNPQSVVNWFAQLYRQAGLVGCSSHSGRRTFVTKAAKAVHKAGGSLRDVQQLAGHRSISMTQRYIDGDSAAQHRLINLI
jgi:integrase/recombinase XerD